MVGSKRYSTIGGRGENFQLFVKVMLIYMMQRKPIREILNQMKHQGKEATYLRSMR